MTPEANHATRQFILRSLQRYPRGVSADMLRTLCRSAGIELPLMGEGSIDAHLLYLQSGGLITLRDHAHTAALELWVLTARGTDAVECA